MTDQHEPPPPDVVPPSAVTPEVARLLRENVGETITVTFPGDVIEDVDGIPTAVAPPQTYTAILASLQLADDNEDQ